MLRLLIIPFLCGLAVSVVFAWGWMRFMNRIDPPKPPTREKQP